MAMDPRTRRLEGDLTSFASVRTRLAGDALRVTVVGDLDCDFASCPSACKVPVAAAHARRVLVDLSRVGYIDAAGVAWLTASRLLLRRSSTVRARSC
jgi:anti-anti-sigma regulatory factor